MFLAAFTAELINIELKQRLGVNLQSINHPAKYNGRVLLFFPHALRRAVAIKLSRSFCRTSSRQKQQQKKNDGRCPFPLLSGPGALRSVSNFCVPPFLPASLSASPSLPYLSSPAGEGAPGRSTVWRDLVPTPPHLPPPLRLPSLVALRSDFRPNLFFDDSPVSPFLVPNQFFLNN